MKALKTLVICLAVLGLSAGTSFAGITGTPHELGTTNANGEICLPCHTPHGGGEEFLWNHQHQADAQFTKWDGATLNVESLTCLGCHDGQTGVDNYGGGNNTGNPIDAAFALGTDLTNDHPVGVEYPTSGRYAAVGSVHGKPGIEVGSAGLMLFQHDGKNTIECATCHTPHDDGNGDFLRMSNAGSALCTACHTTWK